MFSNTGNKKRIILKFHLQALPATSPSFTGTTVFKLETKLHAATVNKCKSLRY